MKSTELHFVFSIGGSIPIVFAYFGEFCPLDGRGKKLGFLLMFWVLGGIYVSGLAWLIIPQTGTNIVMLSRERQLTVGRGSSEGKGWGINVHPGLAWLTSPETFW